MKRAEPPVPDLERDGGGLPERLVLFDGECNLCTGVVRFLLKRDPKGKLTFCPMQTQRGRAILEALGLPTDAFESFVYIEDGTVKQKSAAFFRLVRHLRFPWPAMRVLGLAPRPVRDWMYDFVARRRYRWFGKRHACMRPAAEDKARFLDS